MKILIVAILLAGASFGFARYQYVSKNTASVTIGHTTLTGKNPMLKDLFSDWVKDEWIFAIAVPSALIAGGLVLTMKK